MASTLIGLDTGASLGGYRLERLLGRGETGSTYLAEHVESRRHVALKVVAPALADAPGFRARFLGDCEIAAGLDHPGVLPVYGAGVDGGVLYVATRYVEGSGLGALLREGPIPPEQAVAIVEQVAGALHAAHCSGLVHRDVRPSSILVEAGTHRVYVTDFGLARKPTPDSAPERVAGELLDGRADVYSLAHVLAGCLGSGDPGPEMRRVLAKAAADDPSDRFTTTVEFAKASRQALPAVAVRAVDRGRSASRTGPWSPPQADARRRGTAARRRRRCRPRDVARRRPSPGAAGADARDSACRAGNPRERGRYRPSGGRCPRRSRRASCAAEPSAGRLRSRRRLRRPGSPLPLHAERLVRPPGAAD